MKVSTLWLSEMLDLSGVSPAEIGKILTDRGLEVEAIESQSKGLDKVVTAKLLTRDKHPDSDRLSVCQVSLGGEPLQIVCGAQNMKAGDLVVLAQVGALLPNGLAIAASKIRGVLSHGMLCSEEELGILKPGQESAGIMILPPGTAIGEPFAKFLDLGDTLLTLKLTANRGDCLSHMGIARELSAALGRPLSKSFQPSLSPAWEKGCPIQVKLSAGAASTQFYGISISGVKIGPSPAWLVKRLEALGQRSISNVVDATNLVMLELGQPLHAYDAGRIEGGLIEVRIAKAGESLPLLDGQTVELVGDEIVIADAKRAVGLAGVMGGGNSEVSESTKDLFLECAAFSPVQVRKSALRHGRRTEAALRFEKGLDPQGLERAITRLAEVVIATAGGTLNGATRVRGAMAPSSDIIFSLAWMARFLGIENLESKQVTMILEGLGCKVVADKDKFVVTSPSFRLDLKIKEDLAEEVARTIGYDKIPSTLPALKSTPVVRLDEKDPFAEAMAGADLLNQAKDLMVGHGFSEALCYAFTSKAWLSRFGWKAPRCIVNPLSEEQEALVPSLLPGLVQAALGNWHRNFGSEKPALRLFEMRPVFAESTEKASAKSPLETSVAESWRLSFVSSGSRFVRGLDSEKETLDLFDLKAVLEDLFDVLGTRGVRIQPLSKLRGEMDSVQKLFHPGMALMVLAGKDVAGTLGLCHPRLAQELKLKAPLWMGELDWKAISRLSRGVGKPKTFEAWGEYPTIERDFALLVGKDTQAEDLVSVALKTGKPLIKSARVFDSYQGKGVPEGFSSLAVRVVLGDPARSLQEKEAEEISQKLKDAWKKELGVELRC